MVPEDFVRALHARAEAVLRKMADVMNKVPARYTLAESAQRITDLFVTLREEALSVAWDLRFEAAENRRRATEPADKPWGERYSRFQAAEAALPPPARAVASWVEKFRRIEAGELTPRINDPGDHGRFYGQPEGLELSHRPSARKGNHQPGGDRTRNLK